MKADGKGRGPEALPAGTGEGTCLPSGAGFGTSIVRILGETLGAIIMITDPEKVRETLESWENETAIGEAAHD